jgi:hypothetical protein
VEIVHPTAPSELVSLGPWTGFLAALIADVPERGAFVEALADLLCGAPRRLCLYGNGPLVSASEFNLDILRSLCSTLSERFNGGLDGELPPPAIRYHPALHRCDLGRLLAIADREQTTSFFVIAMDCTVVSQQWTCAPLATSAGLPQPALVFFRWLLSDFQLATVEPRLEMLDRWAHRVARQPLKAVSS